MNDFIKNNVNTIINDDNINVLKKMPDNSVSGVVTDVPYALCDIDALAMIKEGINNKGDFMGKKWFLPSIDFLKECHRVLKDGSFFITTFSPRQDLQCVFTYRALEAGFDINFTPILWCQAQGFPKASDYGRMADRRANEEREIVGENPYANRGSPQSKMNVNLSGSPERNQYITKPTTPEAKYLDGLKSVQLKPAYETILIFQKPHKQKSKIDQALVWYNERKELLDKGIKEEDLYLYTKNASGGIRIDKNEMFDGAISSRIPILQDDFELNTKKASKENNGQRYFQGIGTATIPNNDGRFPATILCGSGVDIFEDEKLLQAHDLILNYVNPHILFMRYIQSPTAYEFHEKGTISYEYREKRYIYTLNNAFYKIQYDITNYKGNISKLKMPPEYSYYKHGDVYFVDYLINENECIMENGCTLSFKIDIETDIIYTIAIKDKKIISVRNNIDKIDFELYDSFILSNIDDIYDFVENYILDFSDAQILKELELEELPYNIYLDDNNEPTQHLFDFLDYIGLTLDDFKALSKEELQEIIDKLKKPLDVGRVTRQTSKVYNAKNDNSYFSTYTNRLNTTNTHADQGDLSRYFSLDAWTKKNLPELYKISKKTLELQEDAEKISPFLFTSKADKGSKNAGLDGFEEKQRHNRKEGGKSVVEPNTLHQNTNPCAKPISLYAYLTNLFTFPHDLVLDPYCGSGTTPIACVLTNRHYIGLELEKEYFDIAEARVKYWKEQKSKQNENLNNNQPNLF